MSRFFVESGAVDKINGRIIISGEDVRHIRSVLRSVPGDRLELSDGNGTDYDVTIDSLEKDGIFTRIIASRPNKSESPLDITLFQGIPKSDKMDFIIQKCVELGVRKFVPVITARTVVKFDNAKDAAAKAARWQRIALEAAKQCDRGMVPAVSEPVRFQEALKLAGDSGLKLIPYEEETDGSLRFQLERAKKEYGVYGCAVHQGSGVGDGSQDEGGRRSGRQDGCPYRKIAVFIGPEGGFAPEEVAKAVEIGFASVTLGPRILRTETAGIAVVSIIGYELGDMSVTADPT